MKRVEEVTWGKKVPKVTVITFFDLLLFHLFLIIYLHFVFENVPINKPISSVFLIRFIWNQIDLI